MLFSSLHFFVFSGLHNLPSQFGGTPTPDLHTQIGLLSTTAHILSSSAQAFECSFVQIAVSSHRGRDNRLSLQTQNSLPPRRNYHIYQLYT